MVADDGGMAWYTLAFRGALIVATVAALRWGDRTERSTAAMLLAAAILTAAGRATEIERFAHLSILPLTADLLLTAGLARLAIHRQAGWLIAMAAVQTVTTLAHLGKILRPDTFLMAYWLAASISSWPTLILLGWGIWKHRRGASITWAGSWDRGPPPPG